MTYDQFWRDDVWIAKEYRQAYVARRKEENHRDWLMGAYVYKALETALSNAFKKKGQQPTDYLTEPFPIFPKTKEEIDEENRKQAGKIEAVYRQMIARQKAEKAAKEQEQQNAEA